MATNSKKTELTQKKIELRESEAALAAMFNIVGTGILLIDGETQTILDINKIAATMIGRDKETMIGQVCHSFLCPAEKGKCPVKDLGQTIDNSEFQIICADGQLKNVLKSVSTIFVRGRPCYLESFIDITERKQSAEALRQSELKFRFLADNTHDILWTMDLNLHTTYVSPSIESALGFTPEERMKQDVTQQLTPESLALTQETLVQELEYEQSGQSDPNRVLIIESEYYHKDGSTLWFENAITSIRDEKGLLTGVQGVSRNIMERKQLEQKLKEMATHDYLTGLPNRALLDDRFSMAAALAQRNKEKLAVMSLDLDKFKTINDTFGHAAGDEVLKAVSAGISKIIRASDTIARVGGDEFVLVMQETDRIKDATTIAQKILDSFRAPLIIESHRVDLSTSIGIAIYPDDGLELETLIKKSDAAMYYSKGHGRNQFKLFGDGDVSIGSDHKSV
ncbi:MAG: sensor domain-containing diguanylate cyclase [Dehalococcoidia bacterium]|jgi:GGDEF domain-containing protein